VNKFQVGDRIQVRGTIVAIQNGSVMVNVDATPVGDVVSVPMRIIEHADRIMSGQGLVIEDG
jgi:small-conductance mechanosensitive channel